MSYRLTKADDLNQANSASATIISPEGLLLTNSHVVLDGLDKPYDVFGICLSFDANEEPACEYSAFLLGYDKRLDLALLKMAVTNNRGGLIGQLPYYNYEFNGEVKIGQTLDIFGYPGIGGKTLTQTRGQVSGYEEQNQVNYFKTDADISGGNSGGAALDENGNFVGVPTYVVSSYENLGYVLDIKQAKSFIDENKDNQPEVNSVALDILKVKLNLLNDAKDNGYYEHPYYPRFSLTAPTGWEWDNIEKANLELLYRSNEGDKNITITLDTKPFKVGQPYIDETLRLARLYTEYVSNYQEEKAVFAGVPATLLTFSAYDEKTYSYVIPYGSTLIVINYRVGLDRVEDDLAKFDEVLKTFAFIGQPVDQPTIVKTLIKKNPPFTLSRAGQWYFQNSYQPFRENLIATLLNPDALYGEMNISYREIDKDEKELTNTQALQRLLTQYQNSDSFILINKNDQLKLDNLTGWSITYINQGMEQDQTKKTSQLFLRSGDYVYEINYEDLVNSYNQNLPDFKEILLSFKNYNQEADKVGQGEYSAGALDYAFSDIAYHRFEQSISNLASKGIVSDYGNGTFRPEKKITAHEAKVLISASIAKSKRADVNQSGADFLSSETVSLADCLKALVAVYQLNVWHDDFGDAPEWKPYLDKGFELDIIPNGIIDPDHSLTRAEFSYILNLLLDKFKI
jgi:V8-like Glu-specific endopeptidase